MEFTEMRDKLMENFKEMTKDVDHLFEVVVDKDEMWNLYLDSFPAGTNEIYRERRWHDCSCCRQFIKTIGNAVVIKNGKIITIWDFRTDDSTYQPVLDALSNFIKSHAVSDIYVSKFKKIGTLKNYVRPVIYYIAFKHYFSRRNPIAAKFIIHKLTAEISHGGFHFAQFGVKRFA